MRSVRQLLSGLLIALVSIGIIIGGLSLSLAEGEFFGTVMPTATFTALPDTPTPGYTPPPSPPTETTTPPPLPQTTQCPMPTGWISIIIEPGDSLLELADVYQTTPEFLVQVNCLVTSDLSPGSTLYVPPIPTKAAIPCSPPPNWVLYMVQPGDTLYSLSRSYGITVQELQRANCMGGSTLLIAGRTIRVPPWAPLFPPPLPTDWYFIPTATWDYGIPTDTETPTQIPPEPSATQSTIEP